MPPKRKKKSRTRGRLELGRLGLTHDEIGRRLNMSRVQVSYYASGARRPSAAVRKRIQAAFNIDPAAWDVELPSAAAAPRTSEPASTDASGTSASTTTSTTDVNASTVRAQAGRLSRMVDSLLERIETDASSTPAEISKLMADCGRTLSSLGKLTGEATDLPESKLVRLPAWRRLEDLIIDTLRPWPEAAQALAVALAELADERTAA